MVLQIKVLSLYKQFKNRYMETAKELINRSIIALGFNLESLNYDYCNVIQSCGITNNIPTLHKTKAGDTKLYGNVNIVLHKVGDLDISYYVSITVNVKKKHCRTWDNKHEFIVPNTKLDINNLESVKESIWKSVKLYYSEIKKL